MKTASDGLNNGLEMGDDGISELKDIWSEFFKTKNNVNKDWVKMNKQIAQNIQEPWDN